MTTEQIVIAIEVLTKTLEVCISNNLKKELRDELISKISELIKRLF